MIRPTMQISPTPEWNNAVGSQNSIPAEASTPTQSGVGPQWTATAFSLPAWLSDPEDRKAYLEACLEQDIAWQIRLNREAKGMTQAELAELVGTRQSSIARAEDTTYGKHSLAMLAKIANAFGCGLLVRFVPYEEFLESVRDTSPEVLTVAPHG